MNARANRQSAFRERFPAARFYRETGLPELNGYTPVSKLLWLKENEPEIYEKTVKFLLLEDYIIYRLTGEIRQRESARLRAPAGSSFPATGTGRRCSTRRVLTRRSCRTLLECGAVVPGDVLPEVRAELLGLSDDVRRGHGRHGSDRGRHRRGQSSSPGIVTETTGTALCLVATLAQTRSRTIPRG